MSVINKVIPTPKKADEFDGSVIIDSGICCLAFEEETKEFITLANKAGFKFSLNEKGNTVIGCVEEVPEGYVLSVNEDGINLSAADRNGILNGFATLLQLIDNDGDTLTAPLCEITDKADFEYRGLMIDCARSRHSVELIKNYIDICWFYKIKYLHIHFCDDESYTLPSKLYPKLTTEGKSYSPEEIAETDLYAYNKGVQIIPEIDTPGHSTSIQNAYPELFGNKGIICFHRDAIEAVGNIYKELCTMFPHSEYIHIGGDESRLGWWLSCDKCIECGKGLGFDETDESPEGIPGNEYTMLRFLAYFINENAKAVLECGKKPICWEGFHKVTNDMITKDVTVMVFDSSFQISDYLIEGGFKVINCSWLPTYVVTPTWFYPPEDCFKWDVFTYGTINEQSVYGNKMVRCKDNESTLGGQLSSWGDTIEKAFPTPLDGHRDELEKILERLPYIAENTWNRVKLTDFASFEKKQSINDALIRKIIDVNE